MGIYTKASSVVMFLGGLSLAAGLCLLLAGFYFPGEIQNRFDAEVYEATTLRPDSEQSVWDRFTTNTNPEDAPDIVNMYLWNITNLQDVHDGGKPILDEVGPYSYRKWRQKVDVEFNRGGEVSFSEHVYYTNNQEPGGADADADVIVTLNLPLMGALKQLDHASGSAKALLQLAIQTFFKQKPDAPIDGLFMTRTANKILFGYDDELLQFLSSWLPSLKKKVRFQFVKNQTDVSQALSTPRDILHTGFRNKSEIWKYKQWQGLQQISCWNEHIEVPSGHEALQFSPHLQVNSSASVFVGELFRNVQLNNTGTMYAQGIKLLRYAPDDSVAAPNKRFYGEIPGLMNVSACHAMGASGSNGSIVGPDVLVSMPHFCYVDPVVLEQTVGVKCDPEKHDLFLAMEPTTGITMKAAKRLQISSTFDGHYPTFDPKLRDTILPIFWAEEISEISESDATRFKAKVYGAQLLVRELSSPWMIVIGLVFLVLGILLCIQPWRRCGAGNGVRGSSRRSNNPILSAAQVHPHHHHGYEAAVEAPLLDTSEAPLLDTSEPPLLDTLEASTGLHIPSDPAPFKVDHVSSPSYTITESVTSSVLDLGEATLLTNETTDLFFNDRPAGGLDSHFVACDTDAETLGTTDSEGPSISTSPRHTGNGQIDNGSVGEDASRPGSEGGSCCASTSETPAWSGLEGLQQPDPAQNVKAGLGQTLSRLARRISFSSARPASTGAPLDEG